MLLLGVDQRGKVSDKIKEYLLENESEERDLTKIRDKAADQIKKSQEENERKLYTWC